MNYIIYYKRVATDKIYQFMMLLYNKLLLWYNLCIKSMHIVLIFFRWCAMIDKAKPGEIRRRKTIGSKIDSQLPNKTFRFYMKWGILP